METLKITKKEWVDDYSTQEISGHLFMSHPRTVYKNANGLPFFMYKYFDSFGSISKRAHGFQVQVIVTDWLDFDTDTFKKQLKEDTAKRLSLFTMNNN